MPLLRHSLEAAWFLGSRERNRPPLSAVIAVGCQLTGGSSMEEQKPSQGCVLGKREWLVQALGAFAFLYVCCGLAAQPAYADVSLSSTGMGHGAPNAEVFMQFQAAVRQYNASGERLRIDTYCPSACTMFLAVRNVCIAPSATLAFHAGGSMKSGVPNALRTEQMLSTYKPALRRYLTSNHFMDTFDFHTISGEEMIKRFGYSACR
jgi:hypothetical protein